MTRRTEILARWTRWTGNAAVFICFSLGVVLLLLWLAGKFEPKVPEKRALAASLRDTRGEAVPVRSLRLPRVESAVGSIRAVHETSIGSKLLSRVVEVNVKAGQPVTSAEVLIRLDDTDLTAKLRQASAALAAAEAARGQAAADEKRYAQLAKDRVVSQQEYEKMVTAVKSAEAEVRRAEETINELKATLDWATIRSPMNGIVIDKKVDVGDMVTPGQTLVTLFDPKRMQLVASVRESLAHRLAVGQQIGVFVEGLAKQCSGTVSEIVPQAESASRAFEVKVTGPCPTGIYTGMFGRILIPLDEEQVLVVPAEAVRNVGQLELVEVIESGQVTRRAIRTGRTIDDRREVLSGLREGEQVVVPTNSRPAREVNHG
ncbi:MAG: efflux RND transporter periplasmic adaptor subunit [Pirellulales bacterium]|nr:efflux RND transporter periplasmic adaptor subunit [Pirellulales bacterium]